MLRWVVASAVCLASSGAMAQVRLVRDSGAVAGCANLGEVNGSSLIGGALGQVGYDNAMNEMREKASRAGGTHLLLIDMQSGMMGARGVGEAYRCEPGAAQPARGVRRP